MYIILNYIVNDTHILPTGIIWSRFHLASSFPFLPLRQGYKTHINAHSVLQLPMTLILFVDEFKYFWDIEVIWYFRGIILFRFLSKTLI